MFSVDKQFFVRGGKIYSAITDEGRRIEREREEEGRGNGAHEWGLVFGWYSLEKKGVLAFSRREVFFSEYRARNKELYLIGTTLLLLLHTCSAKPCLGPAHQEVPSFISGSVVAMLLDLSHPTLSQKPD